MKNTVAHIDVTHRDKININHPVKYINQYVRPEYMYMIKNEYMILHVNYKFIIESWKDFYKTTGFPMWAFLQDVFVTTSIVITPETNWYSVLEVNYDKL